MTNNIWGGEENINNNRDLIYSKEKEEGSSGITTTGATENGIKTSIQGEIITREQSSETPTTIIDLFDKKGASDEEVVEAYIDIANNATKFMSTKYDGIVDVPDYKTRKDTWKDIAKMKGFFNTKVQKKSELPENVIYVFTK